MLNLSERIKTPVVGGSITSTAIPRGTRWAVKVCDDDGNALIFGCYPTRAEAMLKAVCLSEPLGAPVRP